MKAQCKVVDTGFLDFVEGKVLHKGKGKDHKVIPMEVKVCTLVNKGRDKEFWRKRKEAREASLREAA